jgi:tripartite-type tricarboxylate transporter receptor subunit TctC
MMNIKASLLITAACLFGLAARAQDFPHRAITIVVPFAAGGGADVQTRLIGQEMSKELGQPIIIENRPGATGNVGLDAVSRAAPDGYTLLSLSNTTVIARASQNQPFDLPTLMTPVGNFLLTPGVLVVNAKQVPARNMRDLVTFLRGRQETMFSSSGNGSGGHLGMAYFAQNNKLNLTHVAYRGAAPALTALLSGEIQMMWVDSATLQPQVGSPELAAISTASSVRSGLLPNLQTAAEQGFPDASYDPVLGISAPPNTPKAVVERLSKALKAASQSPVFTSFIEKVGNKVYFLDGPEFGSFLTGEYVKWGKLMKDANIQVN